MNIKKVGIIVIILLISGTAALFAFNGQTDMELRKNGYKVTEESNSSLKKLKIVSTMNGTIKKAKKVILDIANYKNFMPNIKSSEIFDKKDGCLLTYTIMNAPIISNRDYVLKVCSKKIDNNNFKVYWDTIKDERYPVKKKNVRVTENNGYWLIKKVNDKQIEVTYSFAINPKASAPNFMINRANKATIVKIIKSIEKEIKKKEKL